MREDWIEFKLKDVFDVVTGNTPSKSDIAHYGSEIPFVKPPNLWNGTVTKTQEYLTEKGASKSRVLPPFSTLVTCIGNLGRVGLNKNVVAFNQQINAIKPTNNIDPFFTFYQAQSPRFKLQLEKKSSATTVAIVNKGNFETIIYNLAPLPEQRAIVAKIEELFSSLDSGIADLKKAQEQLKIYRQAVLKKAFEGGFLNNVGRSNKLSIVKLGTLIEKPKYGTSKKCALAPIGIPVLRIPNIGKGIVDKTELKYAEFDQHEISNLALSVGDILTIRSNGSVDLVGKCALISRFDTEFLYAGYLIRLRPNPILIDSTYLLHCLTSFELRVQIESKAKSTSGVNNINSGELQDLDIPIFNLVDQKKIVQEIESRLSVCDKIEESIIESLEKSKALRQSILKKAFEGRLLNEQELAACKSASDYEPASVLLKRIKAEKATGVKKAVVSKKRVKEKK